MSEEERPDSETIDAWLRGELSELQAAVVDAYFEANPDAIGETEAEVSGELLGLAGEELHSATGDEALGDLVDRITTNPRSSPAGGGSEGWMEAIEPAGTDETGLIGRLGLYKVIELIATGGMGVLLRGRDTKLKRTIAIKLLSPQLASNATARERFLREARAAAKLEHDNILPIFAIHDEGAVPFFTMRYASGGTLEDRVSGGRSIPPTELVPIARQVASALGAAHDEGIVHRDIKPANILFDEDGGRPWVCDFGIARSAEDPALTYAGSIAGTPQYMSPEQAEGKEIDGRSDLFSLGAVLYRCATGTRPFTGENSTAVLLNVATEEPPPVGKLNPDVPDWFGHILGKLLTKDLDRRYQDAAALIEAIDNPVRPRRRWHKPALGLGAIAALGLAALAKIPKSNDPEKNSATTLITSFEQDQIALIDQSQDPEFGATGSIVTSGPGITDGSAAVRAELSTTNNKTFQSIARINIGTLKSSFVPGRKLLLDVFSEGGTDPGEHLVLVYFDNRSQDFYTFKPHLLKQAGSADQTLAFYLDSHGFKKGGRVSKGGLADLIGNDSGQSLLTLFHSRQPDTDGGTITVDHLRLIDLEEDEAAPAQGWVELEETGERFGNLRTALEATRDLGGGTLLFSGELQSDSQKEIVISSPGSSFKLQPAPGVTEKPRIVATDKSKHAIFIEGELEVRGLHFSRPAADEHGLPLLGVLGSQNPVVIEDCEFVSAPIDPAVGGGKGVIFTDVARAEVRRCVFRNAGGICCGIMPRNQADLSSRIAFEECLLYGDTAVFLDARTGGSETVVTGERCVVVCNGLLQKRAVQPVDGFYVGFADCVLDYNIALNLHDTPTATLANIFGWTGSRNVHRKVETSVVSGKWRPADGFEAYKIGDFEELQATLPKIRVEGSRWLDQLVDREKISGTPTAKSILEALPEGLESPALETLRKLSAE